MLALARSLKQRQKAYYIAVIGSTGVGKTSFINTATGSDLAVGSGLESRTDRMQFSRPLHLGGIKVILVDTPGLDDARTPEAEVLATIATWLKLYSKRERLLGTVYLHSISDDWMGRTALRSFKKLQDLCGQGVLANCVIGLTMWNEVSEEIRSARLQELCSKEIFFKPATDAGALALPYGSTSESAQALLQHLIEKRPETQQIRRTSFERRKIVVDTRTSISLLRALAEAQRKQQEQLLEMRRELEEAIKCNDEDDRRELEEARRELEEARSEVERGREQLLMRQTTVRRCVNTAWASNADADVDLNLGGWRRRLAKVGLMAKALLG